MLRKIPGLTYEDAELRAKQRIAANQYETARNMTTIFLSARNETSCLESERLATNELHITALILNSSLSFDGRDPQIKPEPEWRTNATRSFSQPNNTQSNRYY